MDEQRNPIEAGLGWCCKEETGFIGSEAVAAARERRHGARSSRRSCSPAPGIPRQGNAVVAGGAAVGEVTSGTLSPSLEVGIGMAYVAVELAEPGTEVEIDVRGKRRPAAHRVEAPVPKGGDCSWPRRAIPDDLRYHPEHDWARIEGDEATFGITWYAQDALGEVVFYEPPEVGSEVAKDQAYAEVESVKAVSDVYAPLSGEIVAVNEARRRAARS